MGRPIRIQFENAAYHITARGNERRAIYRDDEDRACFLGTLGQACERFGLVVHGFCLMPNHYHLLAQTPRANLSDALGWIQATYSIRFNQRHQRSGHLFQGRFKSHLVEIDEYATQLILYAHLNPVRPQNKQTPIPPGRWDYLHRYRWSSHRAYAGLARPGETPSWLCVDWLSYFGQTGESARVRYRHAIRSSFGQPIQSPLEELRGGFVLGSDVLLQRTRCLLSGVGRREEIRWHKRIDQQAMQRRIDAAVEVETDRRIQIWLRVRLGGERMTEVARVFGYRDGSGVHRVVSRLEAQARSKPALAKKLESWRAELSASDHPDGGVGGTPGSTLDT
jgi:REP element-mobilizing transposase RayT